MSQKPKSEKVRCPHCKGLFWLDIEVGGITLNICSEAYGIKEYVEVVK